MSITALIPARLGSSRVSKKVLLPFGQNETLLSWKIKQLKNVLPDDQIVVSSESEEILDIALKLGVGVHRRDYYLSDGHKASFSEVITGIVKDIDAEHIAWVTVVCPLMNTAEYQDSFNDYKDYVINGDYDSLVGVSAAKEYFWDKNGPLNYRANKNHVISQELPDWYKVTNSVYMSSKQDILKNEYLIGEKPYLKVLPKHCGIDIDDWIDYKVACSLLSEI